MKSNKGIISTISILLITTSLFAQNAQTSGYETHLQKGKEYESQKKWIYALGEYYDALDSVFGDIKKEDIFNYTFEELNQIPDVQDAYNSYKNLAEKIKNGTPGYGEFDDFTLLDNWILLLKEFEKYWSENSPQRVYFGKPERTALNRENRTASYEIYVSSRETPKYREILEIVRDGFRETNPSNWNVNLSSWPEVSVYDNNIQKEDDNMMPDGVPLLRIRSIYYDTVKHKDVNELGRKSAATIFDKYANPYNPIIKFNVVDLNGNVLLKSERYKDGDYIFNNVPQQTMNLIDSEEINIVLDSAYLKYGTMDVYGTTEKSTEIELDANKIPCITWKDVDFEIARDKYWILVSYKKDLFPKIKNYLLKLNEENEKKQKKEEELAKIEEIFKEGVPSIYEILPYTSSDKYFNAGCLDFRGDDCGIWFAPVNFLGKINQDERTWKKVEFYTDHLGIEKLPISSFYNPEVFTIRIWKPENLKEGKYKIVVRTRNHGDNKQENPIIELVYDKIVY